MYDNSRVQTKNLNSKIDEPNLKILQEQLSFESMMYKKYNHYAASCNDAQLKSICHKGAQRHKENYINLLNYLNAIK